MGFRYVNAAMIPVAMVAASAKVLSSGLPPPRIDSVREAVNNHQGCIFDSWNESESSAADGVRDLKVELELGLTSRWTCSGPCTCSPLGAAGRWAGEHVARAQDVPRIKAKACRRNERFIVGSVRELTSLFSLLVALLRSANETKVAAHGAAAGSARQQQQQQQRHAHRS